MRFDPAADPWGTAMLAAAVLWVFSLLVVVFAFVADSSRRTGARFMTASLVVFLVAAVGGTRARILSADAEANRPPPPEPTTIIAPDPPADEPGAAAAPGSAEAPPEAADAGGDAGSEGHEAGAPGEPGGGDHAEDEGETGGGTVPPIPAIEPQIPQVDPLPAEAEARKSAIRGILREARRVTEETRTCNNLDKVAVAWAKLQTIPADLERRRVASAARNLEECRRKLLFTYSRKRRREQVDARDAYAETLSKRFRDEEDMRVVVTINGMSHERLRIGGSGLDKARAEAILAKGLRQDLLRLRFARVVLSNGKVRVLHEFETIPDSRLGLPDLEAVGLGEPLKPSAP